MSCVQQQHLGLYNRRSVAITSGKASAGEDVLVTACPVVTSVIVVRGALQI